MPYIQFTNPVRLTLDQSRGPRFLKPTKKTYMTMNGLFTYTTPIYDTPRSAILSGIGTVRNSSHIEKLT